MTRAWFMAAVLLTGMLAPADAGAALERAIPNAAAEAGEHPEHSFRTSVDQWIAELSRESEFEAWRSASWTHYPLGPGTHGWVIIIRDNGYREIGYLIVSATADGKYRLMEYGSGHMPLFSETTLRQSLESAGLEGSSFSGQAQIKRLYMDALHAFWKVSENGVTRYADAKSGMWLPAAFEPGDSTEASAASLSEPSGAPVHKVTEAADPYARLDWLDAQERSMGGWNDFAAIWEERSGTLVFRAELDESVMIPYGVAGYHWWAPHERQPANGGRPDSPPPLRGFVALEDNGTRFVPLHALLLSGSFH